MCAQVYVTFILDTAPRKNVKTCLCIKTLIFKLKSHLHIISETQKAIILMLNNSLFTFMQSLYANQPSCTFYKHWKPILDHHGTPCNHHDINW